MRQTIIASRDFFWGELKIQKGQAVGEISCDPALPVKVLTDGLFNNTFQVTPTKDAEPAQFARGQEDLHATQDKTNKQDAAQNQEGQSESLASEGSTTPSDWRAIEVTELGLAEGVVEILISAGLETAGQVFDQDASEEGWEKITGIGPQYRTKLQQSLIAVGALYTTDSDE